MHIQLESAFIVMVMVNHLIFKMQFIIIKYNSIFLKELKGYKLQPSMRFMSNMFQ